MIKTQSVCFGEIQNLVTRKQDTHATDVLWSITCRYTDKWGLLNWFIHNDFQIRQT